MPGLSKDDLSLVAMTPLGQKLVIICIYICLSGLRLPTLVRSHGQLMTMVILNKVHDKRDNEIRRLT